MRKGFCNNFFLYKMHLPDISVCSSGKLAARILTPLPSKLSGNATAVKSPGTSSYFFITNSKQKSLDLSCSKGVGIGATLPNNYLVSPNFGCHSMNFSSGKPLLNKTNCSNDVKRQEAEVELSQRQKLQRAIKEYGSTVIVFHVGISLLSLGGFYAAVSSGLDVEVVLRWLGLSEDYLQSKVAAGASTFVLAYAVHKVFAPVRIGITLTCTPLIVRYLRRIGFLKPPKSVTK